MDELQVPKSLSHLTTVLVLALRQVYDVNAGRHDEDIGDDATTFGINVYRNSWFRIEQDLEESSVWTTSRPEGSLVISGVGYRVHVYRHGTNEDVDLDGFRLDDSGASLTKKDIARTNGQLTLALDDRHPGTQDEESELRELVVVHAGNPDDGCCGIWIGAPLPTKEVIISPWAWLKEVWLIRRSEAPIGSNDPTDLPRRHDELPEPHVDVRPVERGESSAEEA